MLKRPDNVFYNSDFFKAVNSEAFSEKQKIRLIKSYLSKSTETRHFTSDYLIRMINSNSFSREDKDYLIYETVKNFRNYARSEGLDLLKILKSDKHVRGRSYLLSKLTQPKYPQSVRDLAAEIIEDERRKAWYEIF